ncbi:hypothetical protein G9A89_005832 [Geosiphon pyriformis]|nr:hypothetical protein G9A89_005832 [Geosiphon pyriformis]
MQQQFPITYADKGKGRIQTPAATPKKIQLPSWKKHKVESPTTLSYYYTLRSAINILSADMSTSNATSTFGRFQFQSKQRKEDLLGPYNFGAATPWELSKKKEERKNPEIETPNIRTQQNQNNQNPDLINQPNVPPNIVINYPPIDSIVEPIQQPFQQLNPQIQQPQRPPQQPPLQQQLNVNQMVYALITKLENFTANNWDDVRVLQAIPYFLKETKQHSKNNFKVVTTPDATTLEYYQSIYTHCKQRFNIPDGIEVVKKSVYQYIKNRINNYLFGNYNISEVRNNLYNNLVHYSQLGTEDLNSETLATYFQELNFNIIKYCEETYPVQSQYSIDFESETETSNKGKQKLKQYSKTTPNTPILPKTTVKHLQTPEQETSLKLPLTITLFPALLAQTQTLNSFLNRFARLEDFILPKSPTRQQEPLQTSSNLLDFLAENQSEHSETAANEENDSEISEEKSINRKNEKNKMTAYIVKISEFNEEDIETSPQEWLDQDKLIKKVHPHVPEDLNSVIQHAKRYKMAMEEANCIKLVNLAIGETSSAAEKKIDQLTKKVKNYFTNQQQQQFQRYQPPQRWNQNNFTSSSNNQPQNCHYCEIPGHWKRDCRKLQ